MMFISISGMVSMVIVCSQMSIVWPQPPYSQHALVVFRNYATLLNHIFLPCLRILNLSEKMLLESGIMEARVRVRVRVRVMVMVNLESGIMEARVRVRVRVMVMVMVNLEVASWRQGHIWHKVASWRQRHIWRCFVPLH